MLTAKATSDGHLNVGKEKDTRILDLQKQVDVKDEQLRAKDSQIDKLNENMHKQAVHIQSLIQEISRLNIRLLPKSTEQKKKTMVVVLVIY